MPPPFIVLPILAAALAIVSGLLATMLTVGDRARFLVPASGALLAGVTVFGLIPELREKIGWTPVLALVAAGFLLLFLLDRAGIPVCPSCQHGGAFATSLVGAIAVHAFVDGWALVATGEGAGANVSRAIAGAMLLHKVPEGIALGAMLRVSTQSTARSALLLCIAETATVAGGVFGQWTAPELWMSYLLAAAGGTFLFLGLHAIDFRREPSRENSL